MNPKLFPTILIVLMTASAIVCGFNGDIRKVIYWIRRQPSQRQSLIKVNL